MSRVNKSKIYKVFDFSGLEKDKKSLKTTSNNAAKQLTALEKIIAIALILFLFCDNPFFKIIGIKFIPLFLIAFVFAIIFHRPIATTFLKSLLSWLNIISVTCCSITSLYNQTWIPVQFGILAVIYFSVVESIETRILDYAIKLSSIILTITTALGVLAILLSSFGFPPMMQVSNLGFYPFSLLYPTGGTIMRMAGFFHEPGQLSFYLCYVSACREILGLPRTVTWWLLTSGLLTLSLAHALFLSIFILVLARQIYQARFTLIAIFFSIVIAGLYIGGVFDWMEERVGTFMETPEEWGRYNSFENALKIIDGSGTRILFGPEKHLAARTLNPDEQLVYDNELVSIYGENILSPIVLGGVLACIPYFLFIFVPIFVFFRDIKSGLILFSCSLLTWQRPYTIEFPYALIVAVLWMCYKRKGAI